MKKDLLIISILALSCILFAQEEITSESVETDTIETTVEAEEDTIAIVEDDTTAIAEEVISDTTITEVDTTQESVVIDTMVAISDTIAAAISDTGAVAVDTSKPLILEEVPPTLEHGYKGFGWGMTQDLFKYYVEVDSFAATDRDDAISFWGTLGEDTIKYTYYFSDKGFWKVRIDFQVKEVNIDDYVDQFERVEKFLIKRYGSPKRTSRNDLGTKKEYWFSSFPKISRAYYRSSWLVDNVKIDLLLDARAPAPYEPAPVFDDLASDLVLLYYNEDFFEIIEPDTSRIPEEKILDAY